MRGSGRTTKQISLVKPNGYFVWGTENVWYPKRIAELLGRQDVKIVGPSFFIERFRGLEIPDLVLDHAVRLNSQQRQGFLEVVARIRQKP